MSSPSGDAPDSVSDAHPSGGSHNTPEPQSASGKPGSAESSPGDAPGASNRRKWLLIGAAAVMGVAVVIGVAVWYFTSAQSADSPSEAAEIYLEAIRDRDTDQAGKVLCNAITNGRGVTVSDEYNVTKLKYDVGEPQRISATKFRVPVTIEAEFTSDGAKTTQRDTPTYQVIKEDGNWKVCGLASAGSSSE